MHRRKAIWLAVSSTVLALVAAFAMFFTLGSGSTTAMWGHMGDYLAKDTGVVKWGVNANGMPVKTYKLCKWNFNPTTLHLDPKGASYPTTHYTVGMYYGSYQVAKTGTNCTTY
jgi:hypothetical protein